MFLTKKVEKLLENLKGTEQCLVFAENGIAVEPSIQKNHCFLFSDNPQRAYAEFANMLYTIRLEKERNMQYTLTQGGYYLGENARIGSDAYIEPGCLIGHNVVIGNNARIFSGSIIKNAVIGDHFLSNEHAVTGAFGFTMAEDAGGNKFRIPTLGKVIIGDWVEIGAHDNISCGSGGDTRIEDYVKIDALVHIGHDVHLHRNTEITAGGIIGGFVEMEERAYTGINASIRNRITVEKNSLVGMGAVVTKNVMEHMTVVGNPAHGIRK